MAAGDVVGEDLQFRLVHHLTVVGQEQTVGLHLAVGLLRDLADDDLALENAGGITVDHRLEHLAADTARRRVVGEQGRIRELAVTEQRRAVDDRVGVRARDVQVDLVARELGAGDQVDRLELRTGVEPHREGREGDGCIAFPVEPGVAEGGLLADVHVQRIVGLVGEAGRTLVALQQEELRPGPHLDQHAGRGRERGRARADEAQMHGRPRLGAGSDRDQRAVCQEGGVELVDRVLAHLLDGGEQLQAGIALRQSLVERGHRHALGDPVEIRQGRHEMAVDEGEARGLDLGEALDPGDGGPDRVLGRRLGGRGGFRDGGAQVRVLERLDPAARQAGRLEEAECLLAADRLVAGEGLARGLEQLREAGLGGGAEIGHVGHYAASLVRYSA